MNLPATCSGRRDISHRDKQILAGLFLSKFDRAGLQVLGFSSFTAAFNAIGYALGARPTSIKNYRDEFDPLFPNKRKGWRKRPTRDYCKSVYTQYDRLPINEFAHLIKALIYDAGELDILAESVSEPSTSVGSFAKRIITGLAAERYFESVYRSLPLFRDYEMENVTRLGCGFDFRLSQPTSLDYLAIEVKGLNEPRGSVSLTEKEHRVAGMLNTRFCLFVVRNFRETPVHDIYPDPLNSGLSFIRQEKAIVQVSWSLSV